MMRFLDHPGEMADRIRAHDWSATPLGAIDGWPAALRSAVDLCLGSTFPTAVYWGPAFILLYNDAWARIPADRHPWALGRSGAEVWADIWNVVGPQFEGVIATGRGFTAYDQLLHMERAGQPLESYWNYSFTPLRDDLRTVGVLNQGNETTARVLAEREGAAQATQMRELFAQAPGAIALLDGPDHVFSVANPAFGELVGERDLLGRTVRDAMPEVADQGFVDLLDQVYRTGEPHRGWSVPVMLERVAGAREERLIDFVLQPISDAGGQTYRIFAQVTDVTDRVRAQAALEASEERLQLALDSSIGIGTWDWNVAADRVVADARFAELYGVDPAMAAAGAPLTAFFHSIHPDDLPRLRARIDGTLAGAPFEEEYRLVQPDGSVRWVTAQGRPIIGADGRAVRFPGISFDITKRRQAEDTARRAAEELRAATEAQAFVYALAERQRSLDSAAAILRVTAESIAQRFAVDRAGFFRVGEGGQLEFGPLWENGALPSPPAVLEAARLDRAVVDAYRAGQTVVIRDSTDEARGARLPSRGVAGLGVPLTRDGQWIASMYLTSASPRDWTGEEVALAEAVARSTWDSVGRADAVMALRDSEARFRAIANSIDQMVWSTQPDGFHDYYNERWYAFTGVPEGSTDGEAWNGMFHPDDQQRAWEQWSHSLATGEPYRIEYRLRHRSGQYRWVLGAAQPVRDASGAITRWFGTCTDIQEIVDAREVLARSREQLEQAVEERSQQLLAAEERLRHAQKMEALGQLTGGIAHDFNNMLAVVIGALDLLQRRLAAGRSDVARYIDAANDGARRAAALTQRLLGFARQQPLAPSPVDANQMVRGMHDLLNRTLGETVRVETVLAEQLWWVEADANQLENAVLNLSVNARDAMPGGGTLTITTRNLRVADRPGSALGEGDYIEIAVTDTGSGMSEEVAAKAFDPFFTTKEVGKGTGLGLSQVFGFVRQSGGDVLLESAPGKGTSIRLLLPRRTGAMPVAASLDASSATVPRGRPGEVVLVVEDEERVRLFSVEALRELGYYVVEAADGATALAAIDAGERVDLLFTDVVMPIIDGRELARRVRKRLPEVKVLFTSGYTPDALIADQAGPAVVLPKPFGIDQLASRVRATLDAPP